jgi:hypothetical protein
MEHDPDQTQPQLLPGSESRAHVIDSEPDRAIADKSGRNVLTAVEPQARLLPGSKSSRVNMQGHTIQSDDQSKDQKPVLLPGSKSFLIEVPGEHIPHTQPAQEASAPFSGQLLPGSKAGVFRIDSPSASEERRPVFLPSSKSVGIHFPDQQTSQTQPADETPKETPVRLLPGSKFRVITP